MITLSNSWLVKFFSLSKVTERPIKGASKQRIESYWIRWLIWAQLPLLLQPSIGHAYISIVLHPAGGSVLLLLVLVIFVVVLIYLFSQD